MIFNHYSSEDQEVSFWFCDKDGTKHRGRSFHHGAFVNKLWEATAGQKDVMMMEATVHEILRDDWSGTVIGVSYSRLDGTTQQVSDHSRYKA